MSYNDKLRCDNLTTNHEGAAAWRMTPEWELYTTIVTMMGTENKFYESGDDRVYRIADLVRKVDPVFVAQLAVYTRERMHLRSVPLLLLVELSLIHHGDSLVSRAVERTIQRADEITELLMCYQWRARMQSLKGVSHQLLKGVAGAFNKFDEYQFAKYDRRNRKVTLADALVLAHPKAKDTRQAEIFSKIMNGKLKTPYTWETELSALGHRYFASEIEKDEAKRVLWQQLVASRKMGYMATLRNLRNLVEVGVDEPTVDEVCRLLSDPEAVHRSKQLPFRFFSAYLSLSDYDCWDVLAIDPELRESEEKIAKMEDELCRTIEKMNRLEKGLRQAKIDFHSLKQSQISNPRLENLISSRLYYEKCLKDLRNGYVIAKVRKVKHFRPLVTNSIFYNAIIWRGRQVLNSSVKKIHFSQTKKCLKHRTVPTARMLKDQRKLKASVAYLLRQEKELYRKVIAAKKRQIKRLRQSVDFLSRKQDLLNDLAYLDSPLLEALENAVRHTAENIPGFTPNTRVLLASDVSGSMLTPVSENSMVMYYHIGLLLSMLMKNRCPQAVTGMFGSIWKVYDMPSQNILGNTVKMEKRVGEVGYRTNGYLVIDWLIQNRCVMDKVMLFTDCQLWRSTGFPCDRHLAKSWDEYKKLAPDARLYLFDLSGYGQSPVSMERDDVYCIAGWSDKVFHILAALESGKNAIDEIRRIVV